VGADVDAGDVHVGDFAGFDFVMEVVFAADADGAGFELHVEVFGDEGDIVADLVFEPEGAGEDAVIHFVEAWEDAAELHDAGGFGGAGGVVDDDADGATAGGFDATGDGAVSGEDLHESAVDFAGVGAAFGHFVFEFVEFAEDVDGDADVVFGEAVDAGGVVEEDVRVEDEGADADAFGGGGGGLGTFFGSRSLVTGFEGGGAGELLGG
jgi:hypothetical protein